MFTFTAAGKGRGVYTKLRLINEIKSYVTYLIANSTADIYFFSNIEIGHKLSNPHLHTQIWSDDREAVKETYKRVLNKFELKAKRCKLSYPLSIPPEHTHRVEPQQNHKFYNYVIKDYSKDLTDDQIWNLEQTKKRMRKTLGLKLRFYSRSKSKYTSKMYKMVYHSFRVLRALADKFLDLVTSTLFFKREIIEDLLYSKKFVKSFSISSFKTITEQGAFVFCILAHRFFVFEGKIIILFFSPSNDPPFL